MPFESADIGFPPLAIIGFAELVEEFHHRVIDRRGLGEIEMNRLAARQGGELLFQLEVIGEKGGAAHCDAVDARIGIAHIET